MASDSNTAKPRGDTSRRMGGSHPSQTAGTRVALTEFAAPPFARTRTGPMQNWILSPLQDSLLVVATPVLVMALALIMFRTLGSAAATSLIIVAHIVFTVAHHLPTFIRIYGDVELFRQHRWHFIMAPVVPLLFSAV